MKTTLFILLFTISSILAFSQAEYSVHRINYCKNNTIKNTSVEGIWIVVGGVKIKGEKTGADFRFPIIDSSATFEIGIKTNNMNFYSGPFNAWMLNAGSEITLGKITRIKKLLSISEYSKMNELDKEYPVLSRRFFIINNAFTIDIGQPEKVKRIDYLIINPSQKGDGSFVLSQKVIKMKK
ncbi:MAG: hypothetical protein R2792_01860 [Saprospiraceae bacterium]